MRLAAHVPEVDHVQHPAHLAVAGGAVGQLLEDRHVVDELEGGEVRVEAGGLGQIAERAADLLPAARGARVVAEDGEGALVGGTAVASTLNRVVFPAPLGPSSPVTPGVSRSDTSSRARVPP